VGFKFQAAGKKLAERKISQEINGQNRILINASQQTRKLAEINPTRHLILEKVNH
jgi:hypothetical protein